MPFDAMLSGFASLYLPYPLKSVRCSGTLPGFGVSPDFSCFPPRVEGRGGESVIRGNAGGFRFALPHSTCYEQSAISGEPSDRMDGAVR